MPNNCNACHSDNYAKTINPNHESLGISNDCASCHSTNPGWIPAKFTQHNQFYPLIGGHSTLLCKQCHQNGTFNNTPKDCNSCHNQTFQKAANPNHVAIGLSTDCASCHTTNPGWKPTTFNHNVYYPLTGAHASVAENCSACHKTGNIKGAPTDCNGCHNADFIAVQNPNHSQLGLSTDCATCHTTNLGWKPSTFKHDVYYLLTGAHASVADNCSACHKTGNIKGAPTDCNGCHNAAFIATKNPNHSQIGLSTDCATCHTTNPGWKPTTFNHNVYYPLTGAHASVAENCSACHKTGNIKDVPTDCKGCHNADFNAAQNPNHTSNGFSTDCATCHTTNPNWEPAKFPQHDAFFPITGAHTSLSCIQCHKNGNYTNTPNTCNGCHNVAFAATKKPNHSQLGLSTDCASCHTTNPGWMPSTFNHTVFYLLTGAHTSVADNCAACHKTGNIKGAPTDCNGCHNADFNATQNPNHSQLGLSTDCATCHTTNAGWIPAKFLQHNAIFPITGAHTNLTCIQCHKNENYSNTPNTCNGCHNAAFNAAQNPNHASNGFPTDCASCHTTNPGWRPSTFNHNNYYPLTGAHASTSCVACHKNGVYKNTPTDCNACHNAAFNAAQNPNHASSGFSTDCASCHTTNPGWRPSTFNHNNYYPLTGAHSSTTCVACHKNGVYKNTPTDCNACHNADFNAATNPNHASSGFSTDCASCHTTNPGWRPSTFNHNNYYPLTGAHSSTTCVACHKNGVYKNTPTDCNACHNADFNAAQNPNHSQIGLSTDCATCHTTNPGWKPSSFNHAVFYPFTGAHASVADNCSACHKTGNIKDAPTDCNGCHNAAFNAATNPNHASSGFSTDCASCHTTNPGWRPSTFNHNNYYPLTGAHSSTTCVACHKNDVYKNTPTDCNACHNADFNAAQNPNHKTVGLSTDCVSCHTTNPGWRPSSFKHTWPLQGAHAAIALNCTSCHNTGNASAAPTTCIGCHATDYNTATPNHASAGFPTNCTSCHSQNSWSPATWNHDAQYFPIYSGKHKGEWTNCNECHTSAGNFNVFNCLNCHKKAETDKDHKDEKGYIYTSLACFSCHPRGSSDD
jgi:hypothetical protein